MTVTKRLRIHVKWQVINWAIEHGEKEPEVLANNYHLSAWKNPKKETDYPTFNQLKNFSNDTRIPLSYLLSNQIPHEELSFVKFRTINNKNAYPSRSLIDTVHSMQNRQEWLKDYYLNENIPFKFTKVSQLNLKRSLDKSTTIEEITYLLDFSSIYQKKYDDDRAFKFLRHKIGDLGIIVMQNGIVGNNTHRILNLHEFRAFALYDSNLPLIFLNNTDSVKGKIFSLIHELVHLFIGDSEILNVGPEEDLRKERRINQITINILLPKEKVISKIKSNLSPEENTQEISNYFHTSLVATAIRLKQLAVFDNSEQLIEWAKKEQDSYLKNKVKKKKKGGGDFYNNIRSRIDHNYAQAVISEERKGNLPLNTAASMIGIKLGNYPQFVKRELSEASK